jgi:hypothetical protein
LWLYAEPQCICVVDYQSALATDDGRRRLAVISRELPISLLVCWGEIFGFLLGHFVLLFGTLPVVAMSAIDAPLVFPDLVSALDRLDGL